MNKKKCPFCKQEISYNAKACTFCNRVLIEEFKTQKEYSGNSFNKPDHQDRKQSESRLKNNIPSKQILGILQKIFSSQSLWVSIFVFFCLVISYYSFKSLNYHSSGNYQRHNAAPFERPAAAPRNGTIIKSNNHYLRGHGSLTIENGTNLDAVAKLVKPDLQVSVCNIYIRANSSCSINRISEGTYELYFSHGNDWDSKTNTFRANDSYSKFEDRLEFRMETMQEEDGIRTRYNGFTITLHPTIGGKAKTENVSYQEFNLF